jgi:mannose/fructose/N-acetylgalactosamine-specific phosphotransferase system component IIC
LELAYHALGIAEVYITLMLISPKPATWASAIVFETVNRGMTMAFKMIPLRIGVDEAAAAMVSQRLALGTSTGLMLALVRKLRMLLWGAVGLMFALTRPIRRSPVATPGGDDRPVARPSVFAGIKPRA